MPVSYPINSQLMTTYHQIRHENEPVYTDPPIEIPTLPVDESPEIKEFKARQAAFSSKPSDNHDEDLLVHCIVRYASSTLTSISMLPASLST